MVRAFVAIDISKDLKAKLSAVQEELKKFEAAVGWVAKDSLHMTLKFLGEISESQVAEVSARMDAVAKKFSPFEMGLAKLGAFPNVRSPRVIWVGVNSKDNLLAAVNEEVETTLAAIGFERENRPFAPHLTLGRVKGKTNLPQLAAYIKAYGEGHTIGEFQVDGMFLFKSTLKPTGAVYEKLRPFVFGA
jgi:2'-5' RNA ligase